MIWFHVSELAIDRMLAGELAEADAGAMRDHAAGCVRCAALLADAQRVRHAFAAEPPPRWLPRRIRVAPYVASIATALAAALAIVIAWPSAGAPTVRTKGVAIVGYFVAPGGRGNVRRGGVRETVRPGDRVELFTTTIEPTWFAATSVDGAGVRSVYVEPQPVAAGAERVLPIAIDLDATLGTEIVTGVFCREPFADPFAPPPGCSIDHFTLVKVAR